MSARPRVSVVVPAWNAERFVGEAIASVQAQTFADWELVIADDGSTDRTAAIAEAAAAADPRIRVLRLAHTGLAAAARSAGVRESRGEFIALLDADDLWTPQKLARQVAWLDAHPKAAAVTCWHEVFGDPARAAEWSRMIWRDTSPFITVDQIVSYTPATPSLMVRRADWDALGGMRSSGKLKTGEDREFIVRLVLSRPVGRIPEAMVRVRAHPIGASLSTADIERRREREWELHRSLCRSGLLDRRLRKRFKAAFFYNQSRDALFTLGKPFRRDLFRSLATGHAPAKAWVMAALCWLPRPALVRVLQGMLRLRNPRR